MVWVARVPPVDTGLDLEQVPSYDQGSKVGKHGTAAHEVPSGCAGRVR